MKQQMTEVDLEKLVSLARDAGASAYEDLPETLRWAVTGRRSTDVIGDNLKASGEQVNRLKRVFTSLKI
ncbi:hypothetical protein [Oceanicoccus sp. KOV_DT_Chl]|uniref:hypothetical protein n=1 Tax=Oceanicoccus sp. KOV_DT_Chl TaxID=1904639 RepID=UPI000C7C197F|nr:hypothetical protein [Oceanicoccus sp. KOV_DT_Chl]